MSLKILSRNRSLFKILLPRTALCWYSSEQGADSGSTKDAAPEPSPKPTTAAPPPEPFDNTKYNCGGYYKYNAYSFYDMEEAMMPTRVGQPSSVGHYNTLPKDTLAELERTAKQ